MCKMCAKYDQACEYPIHVSRKKRDKEDRGVAAGAKAWAENGIDRRTSSIDTGARRADGLSNTSLYLDNSVPVNNFFPTLDFTADSVPFHNPSAFDGTTIDESWLENFLSYDIASAKPTHLNGSGEVYSSSPIDAKSHQPGHLRPTPIETPVIGRSGSASQSDKKSAKFRVPYFR